MGWDDIVVIYCFLWGTHRETRFHEEHDILPLMGVILHWTLEYIASKDCMGVAEIGHTKDCQGLSGKPSHWLVVWLITDHWTPLSDGGRNMLYAGVSGIPFIMFCRWFKRGLLIWQLQAMLDLHRPPGFRWALWIFPCCLWTTRRGTWFTRSILSLHRPSYASASRPRSPQSLGPWLCFGSSSCLGLLP